ncbi:hypothetical protein SD81_024210 [Tolypothrix campylonemoides VB511288]|nr:hypothetical protein SD81_024210 [Tolypothrix campylonemoides VB511288]
MKFYLSLRSQIILVMLSVSLSSVLVVGAIAFAQGRDAIQARTYEQLVSIRNAKADRVESYFSSLTKQAIAMSETSQIVEALKAFNKAFLELKALNYSTAVSEKVANFYKDSFIPKLKTGLARELTAESFIPTDTTALMLQYHYLLKIPLLDQTNYNSLYLSWQTTLESIAEAFDYTNLYLINENGDIVYSLYPEAALGTNLFNGVYKDSAFAKHIAFLQASKVKSQAEIVDFEPYYPALGQPSAFMISPVFEKGINIGFVTYRFSKERINDIMTYGRKWQNCGLGKTGETYLVGSDYLMRSDSRFLLEDPESFLSLQSRLGNWRLLEQMRRQGTSILWQQVRTLVVDEALKGKQGITNVLNYRKVESLSAYMPLNVPGISWVLIAEISADEAYQPTYDFIRIVTGAVMILGVFGIIIANLTANLFIKNARKYFRL